MKISKKLLLVIIALTISVCSGSVGCVAGEKLIKAEEISNKYIEPSKYTFVFTVRFSNIIFEEKGKKIKIPIFQGKYGDVLNSDIIKYCIKMKYIKEDVWLGYIVKCRRGEVKKTFHEFLDFYKSNILKDVDLNNPKALNLSSGQWTITYDFTIDGVPCYLRIVFDEREEDQSVNPVYKTVYDINLEENSNDSNFTYDIIVGAKSTD